MHKRKSKESDQTNKWNYCGVENKINTNKEIKQQIRMTINKGQGESPSVMLTVAKTRHSHPRRHQPTT